MLKLSIKPLKPTWLEEINKYINRDIQCQFLVCTILKILIATIIYRDSQLPTF